MPKENVHKGLFWEGRSTEDITRPYEITEETEEGYVKAIFVDIQSTFDSLWLLGLMVELKQTVLVTCT